MRTSKQTARFQQWMAPALVLRRWPLSASVSLPGVLRSFRHPFRFAHPVMFLFFSLWTDSRHQPAHDIRVRISSLSFVSLLLFVLPCFGCVAFSDHQQQPHHYRPCASSGVKVAGRETHLHPQQPPAPPLGRPIDFPISQLRPRSPLFLVARRLRPLLPSSLSTAFLLSCHSPFSLLCTSSLLYFFFRPRVI